MTTSIPAGHGLSRRKTLAWMVAAPIAAASCAKGEAPAIERMDPALDAIIPPGGAIEKVAGGFGFLEGPLWCRGELWFSDLAANRLHALGADGRVRLLMERSGGADTPAGGAYQGSNGLVVDKDGSVLIAQHGARRIARVGEDMTVAPFLARNPEGLRFNSPNDMVFSPDGALWVTDPPYGLAGQDQDPQKEAKYNGVYRYKDGEIVAAITDLPRPNGIGFSPDGRRLYVSNSEPDMFVNVYDVDPRGAVSNGRRFISYPGPNPADVPDGLKVDSRGNVWTTGPGGVRIVSPEGKVLGQLKTPDRAQANLAWGGPDRKTVYVLATANLYRLNIAIPGEEPLYSK